MHQQAEKPAPKLWSTLNHPSRPAWRGPCGRRGTGGSGEPGVQPVTCSWGQWAPQQLELLLLSLLFQSTSDSPAGGRLSCHLFARRKPQTKPTGQTSFQSPNPSGFPAPRASRTCQSLPSPTGVGLAALGTATRPAPLCSMRLEPASSPCTAAGRHVLGGADEDTRLIKLGKQGGRGATLLLSMLSCEERMWRGRCSLFLPSTLCQDAWEHHQTERFRLGCRKETPLPRQRLGAATGFPGRSLVPPRSGGVCLTAH